MKRLLWTVLCTLAFGVFAGICEAETWRLDQQGSWQNLDQDPQGQLFLKIAEIKRDIASGNKKTALKALQQLKDDFQSQMGPELDAFIAAEKLFAKNKLGKAAKKYQLFLKDWPMSPLAPSAEERLFSIATAFLQGQKRVVMGFLPLPAFDEGAVIMQDIADRHGDQPIALRALTGLAGAYEKKQLYPDAYRTWSQIADLWPTGQAGQNALLRMAQSLHAAYKGPRYDATWLTSAKSYYQDYQARYPQPASQLGIANTLDLITEQQAYKDYFVANYYEKTDHAFAAGLYYNLVREDWPGTQADLHVKQRSAGQTGTVQPEPKSWRRKTFDLTTRFFDSWFGLASFAKKPAAKTEQMINN